MAATLHERERQRIGNAGKHQRADEYDFRAAAKIFRQQDQHLLLAILLRADFDRLTEPARAALSMPAQLAPTDVLPLARLITDDFMAGTYGRVDIVYSRFVSTLVQRPEIYPLLPIRPAADTEGIPGGQFIFEPGPAHVLEQLVPRYIATRLFQAVLEAKASEESSRMVAMKNATENAEDLIEDLTLSYNKVRQSNITREMIEIASGANAR
mgnify:CR=1 FL=1